MIDILKAALPYASALIKLIELATKGENGTLTKQQIQDEIAAIKKWTDDAEARERDMFANAGNP